MVLDRFRPAVQLVQAIQQLLGIVGDAQEPLRDLALLDQGTGRQPRPSMTCSLASTVWSTGSQFTTALRR